MKVPLSNLAFGFQVRVYGHFGGDYVEKSNRFGIEKNRVQPWFNLLAHVAGSVTPKLVPPKTNLGSSCCIRDFPT